MIRHAEKPDNGAPGLSAQGIARAQRISKVFGNESGYNIGCIVAEHHKKGLSYSFHLRFSFATVSIRNISPTFCESNLLWFCYANESI
jgi:hypothetical protein